MINATSFVAIKVPTPHSTSCWKRRMLTGLLPVWLGLFAQPTVALDNSHPTTGTSGQQLTAQGYVQERTQYRADLRFFAARKAAYEQNGTVPKVPPSLSLIPDDPEYEFLGYMPIATPEAEQAHFERLLNATPKLTSTAEAASFRRPLAAQTVVGVFVNDAGEMWGFKPHRLQERLQARRSARGEPDIRRVNGHFGASADNEDEDGELTVEGRPQAIIEDEDGELTVEGRPQAIIGSSDNRVLRSADNGWTMTAYPWRTFGVLVPNGYNRSWVPAVRCSATKIGERHLLTAAHCVFAEGGGEDSLMRRDWWPGADGLNWTMNGGDPSPNHYKNIEWYYYDGRYVNNGWDSRDFAVLVLYDNANSCSLGWLGYREDYSLAGSSMWNFGYPDENLNCSASPRADDNCGGSLYGMSAKITRTTVPYLFFKHDIQGGQSGSAIYDYNGGGTDRQLVGIVKSHYTAVENRGIKIRDLVFDFIESVRDEQPSAYCNP